MADGWKTVASLTPTGSLSHVNGSVLIRVPADTPARIWVQIDTPNIVHHVVVQDVFPRSDVADGVASIPIAANLEDADAEEINLNVRTDTDGVTILSIAPTHSGVGDWGTYLECLTWD